MRRLLRIAAVLVAGCNNGQPPAEKAAEPKAPPAKVDEEHGHKPGSHGGIIVSLGKDSYHAEAVFEKGRKVRLYMLGKEETRVQEVDAQDLNGFVTPDGSTEAVPVTFKPEPQAGDAKGKTSLFVATSPDITPDGPVYYEDCAPAEVVPFIIDGLHGVMPHALDEKAASRLWDLSETLVAEGRA